MPAFSKTLIVAVAGMALVQFCPAPFLAIPAVVGGIGAVAAAGSVAGAVEGGIVAAHSRRARRGRGRGQMKRQIENQLAWSECQSELTTANVTFSAPSPTDLLTVGIPPACMTLVTVIAGQYDEGTPVVQGTDSVLFQNLTAADMQQIQDALDAHP